MSGKKPVKVNGISVGPEQDWTGELESQMSSSKSETVEVVSKTIARKGNCPFDAAEGRTINANADVNVNVNVDVDAKSQCQYQYQ